MTGPAAAAPAQRPRFLFFFSYARKDRDKFLERFFADLRERVGVMMAEEDPSFRDLNQLEPGDDWPAELLLALQHSQTLVCVYSPWYFKREYCGKEFHVFLERQGATVDESGVVRGSKRIIPVLWLKEQDLLRLGLPPAMLRSIQYTIGGEHQERYREQGLSGILRTSGRKGPYYDIIDEIANLIAERSSSGPALEPLAAPITMAQVRNAFESLATPPPAAAPPAPAAPAPPPAVESGPAGGPGVLRAVYLARSDAELNAGVPVGGALASAPTALRSFVADVGLECRMRVAELRVDPTDPAAPAQLDAELRAATARNEVVLVVGAPAAGGDDAVGPLLERAARASEWRGGVLVLGDAGGAAAAPAPGGGASPGGEPVIVRQLAGAPAESRAALAQLIAELQRRIVAAGAVQRTVAADGPQRRPHVAGPREADGEIGRA